MNFWDELKVHYKMGGYEQKLIYWNVAVFLVSIPFFFAFRSGGFDYPAWLYLSSDFGYVLRHPWTLLTYSFLHGDFWHQLFNMMVLTFSGRIFLTFFSQKQLLGLYLLSAIFAGLVFVGIFAMFGIGTAMIGASGAIMAILFAATTYAPNMVIRLLLIGYVKLWHFTAVVVFIDLLYLLSDNSGGHLAHLAGALFGFVFVKLLQQGYDLSRIVGFVYDGLSNIRLSRNKTPFKKVHRNPDPDRTKTASKIVTKDKTQQQIDDILDKISKSGYDSLTADEKEFLFKAGK
jgi:membrane associated rhomboid family serine protease